MIICVAAGARGQGIAAALMAEAEQAAVGLGVT
jgi:GNAT superfamily N-acetyltransferase